VRHRDLEVRLERLRELGEPLPHVLEDVLDQALLPHLPRAAILELRLSRVGEVRLREVLRERLVADAESDRDRAEAERHEVEEVAPRDRWGESLEVVALLPLEHEPALESPHELFGSLGHALVVVARLRELDLLVRSLPSHEEDRDRRLDLRLRERVIEK